MTVRLRPIEERDRGEVAELIAVSMNTWDIAHGFAPGRFTGGSPQTDVFYTVYERLDPGGCLVAESTENGRLAASCYHRERETHLSLGIMNVHPNYFGQGIARDVLAYVTDLADASGKPLRLVSSVMNLESFSLYTRAGFVPRLLYQDLLVTVPEEGFATNVPGAAQVRDATLDDVDAMAEVELAVSGISRAKDYRAFIENADGFWGVSVFEERRGRLGGYLASIGHPLFNEIGPGIARSEAQGAALLMRELNRYPGRTPLVLVPCEATELVTLLYRLGGRNCELHAAQVRGASQAFAGVSFPTFMPETG
jgi:GNAT superfamily N-acetyltransferase